MPNHDSTNDVGVCPTPASIRLLYKECAHTRALTGIRPKRLSLQPLPLRSEGWHGGTSHSDPVTTLPTGTTARLQSDTPSAQSLTSVAQNFPGGDVTVNASPRTWHRQPAAQARPSRRRRAMHPSIVRKLFYLLLGHRSARCSQDRVVHGCLQASRRT